jgi:hypothetical protein
MFAVNAVAATQHQIDDLASYYYEDTGCEVASACLVCPLPRCKFDDMEWFAKYRRLARDLRIVSTINAEGLSIAEAAERFSMTPRTVFRVLSRCREAMQELTSSEVAVFASLAA